MFSAFEDSSWRILTLLVLLPFLVLTAQETETPLPAPAPPRALEDIVDAHAAELFALAERAVATQLPRIGREILERLDRLYAPAPEKPVAAYGEGVPPRRDAADARRAQRRARRIAELRRDLGLLPEHQAGSSDASDASTSTSSSAPKHPGETIETFREVAAKRAKLLGELGEANDALRSAVVRAARQHLTAGSPAHAYEILCWLLPLDPDNEKLRRALGQARHIAPDGGEEWWRLADIERAQRGMVFDRRFGWQTREDMKRLSQGLLYLEEEKRWLAAVAVENRRRNWEHAWRHETEHFRIRTNAPLKEAVRFGQEVERFYRFYSRVMAPYYASSDRVPAAEWVFGDGLQLHGQKLEVHYFNDRETFLSEVSTDPELTDVPNLDLIHRSSGFYYPGTGRAYFYRTKRGPDLAVVYHEVTHQIQGETTPGRGSRPPVWVVEGFGVFFQSPIVRGHKDVIQRLVAGTTRPGGLHPDAPRDINEFILQGQSAEYFYEDARRENYAVAGAVVHFFLLHKGGAYRAGFLRYAREAYRNQGVSHPTTVQKLYEYTGLTAASLSKEWQAFNESPALFDDAL